MIYQFSSNIGLLSQVGDEIQNSNSIFELQRFDYSCTYKTEVVQIDSIQMDGIGIADNSNTSGSSSEVLVGEWVL